MAPVGAAGRSRRPEPTYVFLLELVASESRNAGFDSSGAEGDEDQPDHGQSAATHNRGYGQEGRTRTEPPAGRTRTRANGNVDPQTQIRRVTYMWTSVFPTVGMAPTDLTTWPMT